jgi:putative transposase
VHLTETLQLHGLSPSIGTVDDALAETAVGVDKTDCIRDGSPFRRGPLTSLATFEAITAAWVHWYNTSQLTHRLDRLPPAKADYYARIPDDQPVVHT